MDETKLIVVQCTCGYKLAVHERNIEEISGGVWGSIPCPNCKTCMVDAIHDKYKSIMPRPMDGH